MENTYASKAATLDLDHIGWRSYNSIKKKAMEQEFSWSGLFISLSIAFFIVISTALALRFVHDSIAAGSVDFWQPTAQVMQLEGTPNYTIDNYLPLSESHTRLEIPYTA